MFGLPDLTQFAIFTVHGLLVFAISLGLLKLFNSRSKQIAQWMGSILRSPADLALQAKVRSEVDELCQAFPAPHEHA